MNLVLVHISKSDSVSLQRITEMVRFSGTKPGEVEYRCFIYICIRQGREEVIDARGM